MLAVFCGSLQNSKPFSYAYPLATGFNPSVDISSPLSRVFVSITEFFDIHSPWIACMH
jgi:hypothetical protein